MINSGNVHGYVKSEYVVTGDDAEALAEQVGTRVATVTTETLRVRQEATTDSSILGLIPMGEELTVLDEQDGFVKVSIEQIMYMRSPRKKRKLVLPRKKQNVKQHRKQLPQQKPRRTRAPRRSLLLSLL